MTHQSREGRVHYRPNNWPEALPAMREVGRAGQGRRNVWFCTHNPMSDSSPGSSSPQRSHQCLPLVPQALERYYVEMEGLASRVTGLLELVLGCPKGFLTAALDQHTSILSCNHYPPSVKGGARGSGQGLPLAAHTDVSLFTLVMQVMPTD